MTKRYQVTLASVEAERIKKLSKKIGVAQATILRELILRSLPEYEKFWRVC